MNRIKISPLVSESLDNRSNEIAMREVGVSGSLRQTSTGDLAMFVPMHYEKNYAYPLIVWLHSADATADQVQEVMLELSMRNYVGVAPIARGAGVEFAEVWEQDGLEIDAAHDAVSRAIDAASMRFNINSNRIFLAGLGAGGTMAFRLAFEREELFAGVISIDGPLPADQAPLRDWSNCRRLPVFWAHDRNSVDFDQEQLCRQLRLLHIAGFSVTLRQYPCEELLGSKALSDANRWIMEMISSAVTDHDRER
jgi:phospholipase/carboxylesterase